MKITDLIKDILDFKLDSFNTTYIAKVTKLYNENEKVDIVPLEFGSTEDGKNVIRNTIKEVPVMQFRNGSFAISSKYNVGDIVLVSCCYHPVKSFLKTKSFMENKQRIINRASYSNSIVLGCLVSEIDIKTNTNGLIIKNMKTNNYMEFKEDGTIEIFANVNVIGDLTANGISLTNHTHTGNMGSPTSSPIPSGGV